MKKIRKPRVKLKSYDVGYYLKQSFTISVKAGSEDAAERVVRKRLDDVGGELAGSERVHYDDGIACVDEVHS
jgi:hypothetical protein